MTAATRASGWPTTKAGASPMASRQVTTMPNPAILTGDFSAETYTPPSGSGLPGGLLPAYGTADCSTLLGLGGNCMPVNPLTGQPFPGNVVPACVPDRQRRPGGRQERVLAGADHRQPAGRHGQLHQELGIPAAPESADLSRGPAIGQIRVGLLPLHQCQLLQPGVITTPAT